MTFNRPPNRVPGAAGQSEVCAHHPGRRVTFRGAADTRIHTLWPGPPDRRAAAGLSDIIAEAEALAAPWMPSLYSKLRNAGGADGKNTQKDFSSEGDSFTVPDP